DYIVHEY
ncbi:hypothetical protein CFOL_v3_29866, partial [Cephalotus follicularis]